MLRKSLKSKPCPSKGKKRKRGRMPTKNRTLWGWKYPDGREVCDASVAGRILYHMRTRDMAIRQGWLCCFCGKPMIAGDVTFEHENGRGAGKQDDRIEIDGKPFNKAAHGFCNGKAGSPKRSSKLGRMGSGE